MSVPRVPGTTVFRLLFLGQLVFVVVVFFVMSNIGYLMGACAIHLFVYFIVNANALVLLYIMWG